jgi:hypothetical protein
MRRKFATCIVYLCAAVASICLLRSFPSVYLHIELVWIASACGLLAASILGFRWPTISHWLGFFSGLVALYWFYRFEFGYLFPALNTWVAFNLQDGWPGSSQQILIAKLKIAFAISALAATAMSAMRLLPAHWIIRNRPVRDRLWPTIAVCLFAVFLWYALSVSPYRIPLIVDAVSARLTLLHVEKSGRQFHETGIGIFDDGRVYFFQNDRRLFQYRFPVRTGSAVLTQDNATRQAAFELAGEIANTDTAPAVLLRSKDAEGWYVRTQHGHVLAFTTENGTSPPPKLVTIFHALQSAIPTTKHSGHEKDICFGFCYDPLAGLGIVYMNERCTDRNGTHCK